LTEDQQELLEKARSSLDAAKWLLEGTYPDFAVSRVYNAMFYRLARGMAKAKRSSAQQSLPQL
jgi:uncharacterized protein (UPF0332 family)